VSSVAFRGREVSLLTMIAHAEGISQNASSKKNSGRGREVFIKRFHSVSNKLLGNSVSRREKVY